MLKSVLIKFLHLLMKTHGKGYPRAGATQAKKDLRQLSFFLDLRTEILPQEQRPSDGTESCLPPVCRWLPDLQFSLSPLSESTASSPMGPDTELRPVVSGGQRLSIVRGNQPSLPVPRGVPPGPTPVHATPLHRCPELQVWSALDGRTLQSRVSMGHKDPSSADTAGEGCML